MDKKPEFTLSLTKVQIKHRRLPQGIRILVYSFLPFGDLISSISKLSKQERQALITSEILDQPRSLKITFRDDLIYDINSLKFMMKLLTTNRLIPSSSPPMMFEVQRNDSVCPLSKPKIPCIRSSVRSVNSGSPILKQNMLDLVDPLEGREKKGSVNLRTLDELENVSDTNISQNLPMVDPVSGEEIDQEPCTKLDEKTPVERESLQPHTISEKCNSMDFNKHRKRMKVREKGVSQKRADIQLLIECEHLSMIPFVRYVLGKA
jgi:hypothetical protein